LLSFTKKQVQDKEGIPPDQQTFFFEGQLILCSMADPQLRAVQETHTLSSVGIVPGSQVHLILSLRGD
jgi:hypothetical protein